MPHPLVSREFALDGEVAADVAHAEAAISRLNFEAASLVDTEALARILLRAESGASSKIEGLQVGARRLLRAEAASRLGDGATDVTAKEILGNIEAMVFAVQSVGADDSITLEMFLELHRRLLAGSFLERHGGVLKQVSVARRNRPFEAPEIINAFTDLERRLASPDADTRVSPPARLVPPRT